MASAKLVNLLGLVFSYLLGQGSFLLSTVYLISREEYTVAAKVGFALSMITLAQFVVDFGGQVFLARQTALRLADAPNSLQTELHYFALIVVRLIVALTFGFAIIVLQILCNLPAAYGGNLLVASIPGLIIWAFNRAGILDGQRRQGLSALLTSLPWVFVSFTTIWSLGITWSSREHDVLIGLSFSLACGITVLLQFLHSPPLHGLAAKSLDFATMRVVVLKSSGFLFSQMPGQLVGRIQIAIAMSAFSVELSSVFILARNIVNAVNNFQGFLRRIEFPDLVVKMSVGAPSTSTTLLSALTIQRFSISFALFASVLLFISGVFAKLENPPGSLAGLVPALELLPGFSLVVLTSALSGALAQSLLAAGHSQVMFRINVMALLVSTATLFLLLTALGVWSMIIASSIANLGVAAVTWKTLRTKSGIST